MTRRLDALEASGALDSDLSGTKMMRFGTSKTDGENHELY